MRTAWIFLPEQGELTTAEFAQSQTWCWYSQAGRHHPGMSITIADVAREAGTSITTVSRVLSDQGDAYRISEPTQSLVVAAAKRLGYRPSYHAKSLKAGKSQTIGLVYNSASLAPGNLAYSATIIGAIDGAVRHAGYHLLLIADKNLYEVLETGSAFLTDRRVDAVVVFGYVLHRYNVHKLPIPLTTEQAVVVVERVGKTMFPTVEMDPAPGIVRRAANGPLFFWQLVCNRALLGGLLRWI